MEKEHSVQHLEAHLANERTLLSYIRTAASLLVLAVALFKFFEEEYVVLLGWFILSLGLFIFTLGTYRFSQEKRRITLGNFQA